jgi:hypothetical protein
VVEFSADNSSYLIELWDKKNEKHPAVCVYLPANGSIYLMGAPAADDQNSVCPYSILTTSGAEHGGVTGTGGGNTIKIGSGVDNPNS